ncbi:MAG: aldehyde dehydrogenase family protein, partial [Ilumatobacteraceae bacterium]
KCSAAARVLVHRSVAAECTERLVSRTSAIDPLGPLERGGFLSPVVDRRALDRYDDVVAEVRHSGTVLVGGHRLTDGPLEAGNFVAPTVVRVDDDSAILTTELFLPVVAVVEVAGFDEAMRRANATPFGLTAGLFSDDEHEIDEFFDRIEAGVVYVNRSAGATTGAWPGVQPFGGWKRSGTNGKLGGGPYYLTQYLREQSRTRVHRS